MLKIQYNTPKDKTKKETKKIVMLWLAVISLFFTQFASVSLAKVNETQATNQPDNIAELLQSLPSGSPNQTQFGQNITFINSTENIKPDHVTVMYYAEQNATPNGKKILQTARQMTLINREILPGSCWDYINAVFNRAGFTHKKRTYVFHENYPDGPFANHDDIQAGDWLYFINHSYHDIQHSSLFIGWVDEANSQGLMLSYGGEQRNETARYRVYDLSHVYAIIRATH